MQTNNRFRNIFLVGMMVAAAFSRMIPHPVNFAPIGALALFGAAYFPKKWMAILAPLVCLWISDLFINNVVYGAYNDGFVFFYGGWYWMYATTLLTTVMGFGLLKKINVATVLGSAVLASILFFAVTNFVCWPGNPLYPQNFMGLMACYIAGVPFFAGTLLGNVFYSAVMFGGFELAKRQYPSLNAQPAKA